MPFYRTFQTDYEICILLGLLEGGDLRFHQDEHEVFPELVLKFWTAQIVLCIEGLHKLGVIHRDIKPENLLLDMKGYVHLSDFTGAVSQPADQRIYDPTYIGTIWYMGALFVTESEQRLLSNRTPAQLTRFWKIRPAAAKLIGGL